MDGRLRPMTAVYITSGERMLLLYRVGSRVVAPSFCGVGGHFEQGELCDARACVLREMREEIGLEESDLCGMTMRYVTLRLKNGEIRENYYFFAELKPGTEIEYDCGEGRLEWVSLDRVLEKKMPHTAWHMLSHYLSEGRYTNLLYGGVTTENGVIFTPMQEF
ncbi:MAG: NUDIX domain-containing protein [Clostridia bacterium]|nr:NUDIX domain-containing protein [Clostridia bacterium]